SDLTKYAGDFIEVNKTEKVGNNIWYRGKLNGEGEDLWLHSNFVTKDYITETNYHLTLQDAVNIQYNSGTKRLLKNGKNQKAIKKYNNEYMDINNFIKDTKQKFQFLVLSASSGAYKSTLNNHLKSKGTLNNLGDAFYNAARKYEVNDLYLIAHAQLETGHG